MQRQTIKSRILALIVSAALLMTFIPTVALAANFGDTNGHWGEAAIERFTAYKVLNGYENGTFKPNGNMTRAELAKVINGILKYSEYNANPFSDISSSDWFYYDVVKLNAAGVLNGDGGRARPNDSISRQEAIVMIARAFQIAETPASAMSFGDSGSIADWARPLVGGMKSEGYIQGAGNLMRPTDNITRAEVITILDNMIKAIYADGGTYADDVHGMVIVNAPNVTIDGAKITGDLYIAPGVGNGDVAIKNTNISGEVYVWGGGANTVTFDNCDIATLVVSKDTVRVVLKNGTEVIQALDESGKVEIASGVTVENLIVEDDAVVDVQKGATVTNMEVTYGTVEINGTVKDLTVDGGTVAINGTVTDADLTGGNVTVQNGGKIGTAEVSGSDITIDKGGTISEMTVTGRGSEVENAGTITKLVAEAAVDITGKGTIKNAVIESNGVSIETKPDRYTVEKGLSAEIADKDVTGSSGGSSTGGSSGSKTDTFSISEIKVLAAAKITVKLSEDIPDATITVSGLTVDGTPTYSDSTYTVTFNSAMANLSSYTVTVSANGYRTETLAFTYKTPDQIAIEDARALVADEYGVLVNKGENTKEVREAVVKAYLDNLTGMGALEVNISIAETKDTAPFAYTVSFAKYDLSVNKTLTVTDFKTETSILEEINDAETATAMQALLEEYADAIGIDVTSEDGYDGFTATQKTAVAAAVYNNGQDYDSLGAVKTKFNDEVKAILLPIALAAANTAITKLADYAKDENPTDITANNVKEVQGLVDDASKAADAYKALKGDYDGLTDYGNIAKVQGRIDTYKKQVAITAANTAIGALPDADKIVRVQSDPTVEGEVLYKDDSLTAKITAAEAAVDAAKTLGATAGTEDDKDINTSKLVSANQRVENCTKIADALIVLAERGDIDLDYEEYDAMIKAQEGDAKVLARDHLKIEPLSITINSLDKADTENRKIVVYFSIYYGSVEATIETADITANLVGAAPQTGAELTFGESETTLADATITKGEGTGADAVNAISLTVMIDNANAATALFKFALAEDSDKAKKVEAGLGTATNEPASYDTVDKTTGAPFNFFEKNTLWIKVTAQDGTTVKYYKLTVTVNAAAIPANTYTIVTGEPAGSNAAFNTSTNVLSYFDSTLKTVTLHETVDAALISILTAINTPDNTFTVANNAITAIEINAGTIDLSEINLTGIPVTITGGEVTLTKEVTGFTLGGLTDKETLAVTNDSSILTAPQDQTEVSDTTVTVTLDSTNGSVWIAENEANIAATALTCNIVVGTGAATYTVTVTPNEPATP